MSWQHRSLNQKLWAAARRGELRAAGYRCRECGRPGRLEVHHKKPLEDGGSTYAPDNLRALCFPCHRSSHADERAKEVPGRLEWRRELARCLSTR